MPHIVCRDAVPRRLRLSPKMSTSRPARPVLSAMVRCADVRCEALKKLLTSDDNGSDGHDNHLRADVESVVNFRQLTDEHPICRCRQGQRARNHTPFIQEEAPELGSARVD